MAVNDVLFTSNTDMWETPQFFFDELNTEFGFTLDVCAVAENAKCDKYYSPDDNGLLQDWYGVVWMNPPYSTSIKHWIAKAYQESRTNADIVVCLVPARTETKWWHEYVMKADEIRLVAGRLKFGGAKWNAPFPSAVVIFRHEPLHTRWPMLTVQGTKVTAH